jgi:hypothetical protein
MHWESPQKKQTNLLRDCDNYSTTQNQRSAGKTVSTYSGMDSLQFHLTGIISQQQKITLLVTYLPVPKRTAYNKKAYWISTSPISQGNKLMDLVTNECIPIIIFRLEDT